MSSDPVLSLLPPVPAVAGVASFESINFSSWIPINSLSALQGVNDTSTALMEGGGYGEYAISNSVNNLNEGDVEIHFTTFGGESDNIWGLDAWSIQLNANFVTASNGYYYWVQFTYQNNLAFPSGAPYSQMGFWIGNMSSKPQPTYNFYGLYVPSNNLTVQNAPSDTFWVTGIADNGLLKEYFTVGVNGNYKSYYYQMPDIYGLQGQWNQASGTILGAGGGSTANFAYYTTEFTNVTFSPASSVSDSTVGLTAEQNNMNYNSVAFGNDQGVGYLGVWSQYP